MTDKTDTPVRELETEQLDQAVGAAIMVPDARKQEQSEKIAGEELSKK